eukprot:CAMPEP_0177323142 /NCGR_PEP_ID=MMETSP0368-20130122/16584_1 /TAXON_ID=447022 ORGANISM="Scrippsiella hangoei-like, Strain SHHI-4" /NCGR_SAMPLE_ID=MMETSP0368 /ASSEMBLY_ACC=CAM_ASM_000363 /LENGTH=47 /DNA_ID= /DNA_START= /DNA_END= /DNA_ORIENTATION=
MIYAVESPLYQQFLSGKGRSKGPKVHAGEMKKGFVKMEGGKPGSMEC